MTCRWFVRHVFVCAGTWRPLDETLSPCDPLEFADMKVGADMASVVLRKKGQIE